MSVVSTTMIIIVVVEAVLNFCGNVTLTVSGRHMVQVIRVVRVVKILVAVFGATWMFETVSPSHIFGWIISGQSVYSVGGIFRVIVRVALPVVVIVWLLLIRAFGFGRVILIVLVVFVAIVKLIILVIIIIVIDVIVIFGQMVLDERRGIESDTFLVVVKRSNGGMASDTSVNTAASMMTMAHS